MSISHRFFNQAPLHIRAIAENTFTSMSMDSWIIKCMAFQILLNHVDSREDVPVASSLILAMLRLDVNICFAFIGMLRTLSTPLLGAYDALEEKGASEAEALENKKQEIADLFLANLVITACFIPPSVLTMVYSKGLLDLFNEQNKNVNSIVSDVMSRYAASMPPRLINLCMTQMIVAAKCEKVRPFGPACFIAATGVAMVFGFGLFGAPKLGISGVLLGYTLEAYSMFCILQYFIFKHADLAKYNFAGYFTHRIFERGILWKNMCNLIKPSTWSALYMLTEMGANFMLNVLVSMKEENEKMAYTLALAGAYTFNLLFLNNSTSGGAMVLGRTLGKKQFDLIRSVGHAGLFFSGIICLLIPCFFALYPQALMNIFAQQNQTVLQMTQKIISVLLISVGFDALTRSLILQLRQLSDFMIPALIRALGWSLTFFLIAILNTMEGMAIACACSSVATFVLMLKRWDDLMSVAECGPVEVIPASSEPTPNPSSPPSPCAIMMPREVLQVSGINGSFFNHPNPTNNTACLDSSNKSVFSGQDRRL